MIIKQRSEIHEKERKEMRLGLRVFSFQTDLTVLTNQQNGSRSSMVHTRISAGGMATHLLAECCLRTVHAWLES